jgi:hypothetical protein
MHDIMHGSMTTIDSLSAVVACASLCLQRPRAKLQCVLKHACLIIIFAVSSSKPSSSSKVRCVLKQAFLIITACKLDHVHEGQRAHKALDATHKDTIK